MVLFSTKFQEYITCQDKTCNKQKKKYDKIFDKELFNPNSKCKKQQNILQEKYDRTFLSKQQMLIAKTLKRNYINHAKYDTDIGKLKKVLDPKLMEDEDFLKVFTCRTEMDIAAKKRDECITKKCGKQPKIYGGKSKRKSKRKS